MCPIAAIPPTRKDITTAITPLPGMDRISQSKEAVQSYLDEWVYGVKDRGAYWQKLGAEAHERLKIASRPSAVVDYGQY